MFLFIFFLFCLRFFSSLSFENDGKQVVRTELKIKVKTMLCCCRTAECIKLSAGRGGCGSRSYYRSWKFGFVMPLPARAGARSQSKNVLWNSVFSSLCEVFFTVLNADWFASYFLFLIPAFYEAADFCRNGSVWGEWVEGGAEKRRRSGNHNNLLQSA